MICKEKKDFYLFLHSLLYARRTTDMLKFVSGFYPFKYAGVFPYLFYLFGQMLDEWVTYKNWNLNSCEVIFNDFGKK